MRKPPKKYAAPKVVFSLDKEIDIGDRGVPLTFHGILASVAPSPLDELIWKEEREEKQKYERYQDRKHRPIPVYQPHDFEYERSVMT